MASTIKVDQIEGSSGSTITVPTGQTLTVTDGIPVASGGTGLASFTAGDILYATGATTLVKLAKGTTEQTLKMNTGATAPEYGTANAIAGGTGQTAWAAGDLLYANGTNTLTKLTKPGSTQTLQMTSAGVPSWVTASSGKTIKRHYFDYNTRTQGSGSAGVVFNYTSSFIPTDPTTNDLWIEAVVPTKATGDWGWYGLRFAKSGGSDYDYMGKGLSYTDPNAYQTGISVYFNIAAGTLPAGTYTVGLYAGDTTAASTGNYFCLSTSDNSEVGVQTVATLMITEWKN